MAHEMRPSLIGDLLEELRRLPHAHFEGGACALLPGLHQVRHSPSRVGLVLKLETTASRSLQQKRSQRPPGIWRVPLFPVLTLQTRWRLQFLSCPNRPTLRYTVQESRPTVW